MNESASNLSPEMKAAIRTNIERTREEENSRTPGIAELAGEALHSAAYSGLQSPVTGVMQLVDKTIGTDLASSTKVIDAPEQADSYSAKWHVQQVSGAAGMVLPFLLARKGARQIMGAESKAALETAGSNYWKTQAIKEGALSGFIYDAALHPANENSQNFWTDRLKQGVTGAATFGTLTASGIGIRSNARYLVGNGKVASFLENPITAATLSGVPAGIVSAQSNSLLFEGKTASLASTAESAYAMSFVGFTLAGAHQLPVSKAIFKGEPSPIGRQLAKLQENAGIKLAQTGKTIQEKTNNIGASIDGVLADILPQGPALAGATAYGGNPGRGMRLMDLTAPSKPALSNTMHMEAVEPGSRNASLSSEARPTGPKSSELLELATSGKEGKEVKEVKEVKAEPEARTRAPKGELAKDVVEGLSQREIADHIQQTKGLRDLRVNPDRIFFGNDALFVLEVLPSKAHPNGAALKAIVPEGGWENGWGKRPGDAKILGKVHEVDIGSAGSTGTAWLFLQELVEVRERYEPHLLDDYFRGLEGKNLAFEEPGNNPNKQFGISQETGKLVLIDYPSTGKPGHMQTLNEIIQGPDYFERQYERENEAIRNGKSEAELEIEARNEQMEDTSRDFNRQRFIEQKELTETEREIIDQLSLGITPKEMAEYMALMQNKLTTDGQPDVKAVMPEIKALIKRAKEDGLMFE